MIRYSYDTNKSLEDNISLFIRFHHGCNKQKVVDFFENIEISSRKTTLKIIKELEEKKIINASKPRLNSRDYKLTVNKDNPLSELHFEIDEIKNCFDFLVNEIVKDNNSSNLDNLKIEYGINVKIISLLSCITKLIISLINEILVYNVSPIVFDKDDLYKQYHYLNSRATDFNLSFDKVKSKLDKKFFMDYVRIFASRNNTPIKTFLWSIMIFYETREYPQYYIYTETFKSKLFSTMEMIYNLGKKYSPSFYDEIVCNSSTYNNQIVGFPYARYVLPLIDELKNLNYREFLIVLIERYQLIESHTKSTAAELLDDIDKKNSPYVASSNYHMGIFNDKINKVIEKLTYNKGFTKED